MKKSILVTGGAGFIGSHLCSRLLGMGHKVTCLDNLYTGSKNNIRQLLTNDDFNFIHQEVQQIGMSVHHYDEIYNLACPASPKHYQRDPIYTSITSLSGAVNLLSIAKAMGAKILQASTSEIYGDPLVHPQPESYFGNVNPIGIRSCYDEGKRMAETLFSDYHRAYGVKIRIARLFNTYGPNMQVDDGRVVSNFIIQALKGEDITIYGDGRQTRSFCYVDDMVDGLINLMEKAPDFSICGAVNLGNDNEFTIEELAYKVLNMTGSKSKVIYHDLPSDDPIQRKPDLTKARDLIRWNPKIQLMEGLDKTVEYFAEVLKNDN